MEVENYIELGSKAWNDSDKTTAKDYLVKAWDCLSDPKEKQEQSFLICRYLIKVNLELSDLNEALLWANKIQFCDLDRADDGDREFLKGKVLYEIGDKSSAREQFDIANKKSNGRCFHGEDKQYKLLISSHNLKELSLEEMFSKANTEYINKHYKKPLELLFDCLNKEASLSDPLIYIRKGQCHYELSELEKSADSFTRAYMLGGGEIFENEDKKYYEFLKTQIQIDENNSSKRFLKGLFNRRK